MTDETRTTEPRRLKPIELVEVEQPSYEDLLGTECYVCRAEIRFGSLKWDAGWLHNPNGKHPRYGHHRLTLTA